MGTYDHEKNKEISRVPDVVGNFHLATSWRYFLVTITKRRDGQMVCVLSVCHNAPLHNSMQLKPISHPISTIGRGHILYKSSIGGLQKRPPSIRMDRLDPTDLPAHHRKNIYVEKEQVRQEGEPDPRECPKVMHGGKKKFVHAIRNVSGCGVWSKEGEA